MMRVLLIAMVSACANNAPVCELDGDCATGSVCELQNNVPTCVAADEAPIRVGQTIALTGTNQGLGQRIQKGVEAAVAEQNAAGGIRGRKIEVQFVDDGYDPSVAASAAQALVDAQPATTEVRCSLAVQNGPAATALTRGPHAVLALLGTVGRPPSLEVARVAAETGTPYFAAITGRRYDDALSQPCASLAFNVRATFAQESRAALELLMARGVNTYDRLLSFDQQDSFGQAGYDGLVAAAATLIGAPPDPVTPVARFRYTRNDDASVPATATAMEQYLTTLLQTQTGTVSVGIMLTSTYGASSLLVKHVRDWQHDGQQPSLQKATRLVLHFANLSFVDTDNFADRLVSTSASWGSYAEEVYVSSVVPNYQTDASPIVAAFKARIGSDASLLALEGYLNARVFIAALLAHEGPFTPDGLAATIEGLGSLDVGLDGTYGFASDKHHYSNSIWGIAVQPDGKLRSVYRWTEGTPIQILP